MRVLAVFRKSLIEQMREIWLVALIMVLAPFFILLYWMIFSGGGAFKPKVAVLDQDVGVTLAGGGELRVGEQLVKALQEATTPNGERSMVITKVPDRQRGEQLLMDGDAATLFILPKDLSAVMAGWKAGARDARARVLFTGDLTQTNYLIASVLAYAQIEGGIAAMAELRSPVAIEEVPLGGSAKRTDFEMALPGLFIFAVIMLMFPTSMALARESEAGTLRRLQMSRMTSFDLLAGLSLFQVAVGVVAVLVAFGVAVALGFSSEGPMWAAVVVSAIASVACVGVGLVVACFSRTVTEAFIICNFPMILMMFFSGSMMPLPKFTAFTVGSVEVGVWDFMPTTHAVAALNKILGLGAGAGDVVYELVSLVVLTALYFGVGVWLFQRRRLAAG